MKSRAVLIAALSATLTLTGCSNGGGEIAETAVAEVSKPEISVRMLESPGKPTVPVDISYRFDSEPAVDQPLTVTVAVSGNAVNDLSMSMSTRGEIALSKNLPEAIPLKANATVIDPASFDAVVTPSAEGRAYLNVQINGVYEGQRFTKAKTIPIQVGQAGPTLAANGRIVDTGVEVLSSMPATQEIRAEDEAQ